MRKFHVVICFLLLSPLVMGQAPVPDSPEVEKRVESLLQKMTLEEKIDEMIERKKDVAGRVVGTGEGWLTELSNADLKDLFALREEAVSE